MELFHPLGCAVERLWREQNYDERVFGKVALEALREVPPDPALGYETVAREFLFADLLPHQLRSTFGEPPLVGFRGDRFFIELLFWLDGTPSIHQHAITGAFHVLAGASLHTQYDFDETQRVTSAFRVGHVRARSYELLQKGDSREITAGPGFIHALFHLERPSVTLSIRTNVVKEAQPQFSYSPPWFAIEDQFQNDILEKRLLLLGAMKKCESPRYEKTLLEFVEDRDFPSAYAAVRQDFRGHSSLEALAGPLEVMRRRHGALVDKIPAVLEEELRQDNIIQRRSAVSAPEHRFFLALLLNLPDRASILATVERRYGGDPIDTVLRWVKELTRVKANGSIEILDLEVEADRPDIGFPFDGVAHQVFRLLLQGVPAAKIPPLLREHFNPAALEREKDGVEALVAAIEHSPAFGRLFA